jgi:hypothetical protein
MLDTEIKINLFLTQYCGMLMADIADERMAEEPLPGVNHPAWILGHLAVSADLAVTRAVKRRPKPHDLLTMPRAAARAKLIAGRAA